MIEALATASAETVKVGEVAASVEKASEVKSSLKNDSSTSFDPRKPLDRIGKELKNGETPSFDPKKPLDIKNDKHNITSDVDTKERIEDLIKEYIDDLKSKSEYSETISDTPFEDSDLKKIPPEENALAREEFDDKKSELKKEWERDNGRPWPTYQEGVYSSNGKLIRCAGSDYDAHHIQPLGLGGKNEVNNITPLHAEVHYDKQGIHAPDSPYSKLESKIGGKNT